MFRVLIETEAKYELHDAAQWYEVRARGVGEKFLNAFMNALDYLEKHPAAFAKITGEYHQMTMKRFPYVIIYRVVDFEVRIISVFHTQP